MKVKECTGECCQQFPIGDRLTMLDMHRRVTRVDMLTGDLICPPGSEVARVQAMLIPLNQFHAYHGVFSPLFTCMHWDKESRRCRNYTLRPEMCKDYPYGHACRICGGKAVL